MLQLKKRSDGKAKTRFMATICFYQDSRHEKPLHWIREILGIGYISKRNDGMTELRINGYRQVKDILVKLLPYVQFKKLQAMALYSAVDILSTAKRGEFDKEKLIKLIDLMLVIQAENYVTRKKKSRSELLKVLGLTP